MIHHAAWAALLGVLWAAPVEARHSRPHAHAVDHGGGHSFARGVARSVERPASPQYTDGLAEVAASYARLEKWDRAVELLDEVRATRPNDLDALDELIGACAHSARCAPRRLALLREGLAKLPRPGELLEELARELGRRGRSEAAIAELRAFVQSHPDNDDARELYLDTAIEQGQSELAMKELPAYLARRPDDLDKRLTFVELLRDAHRASYPRELETLVRLHPDNVSALCLRAELHVERGELAAAQRVLVRLRALIQRSRDNERICAAEDDVECVAELAEDRKRVAELDKELAETRTEHYRDFRSDVVWLDFAEDLEREQDREP